MPDWRILVSVYTCAGTSPVIASHCCLGSRNNNSDSVSSPTCGALFYYQGLISSTGDGKDRSPITGHGKLWAHEPSEGAGLGLMAGSLPR
jgi:hypothetical protein